MKKSIFLIVMLLLTIVVLAGCQSKGDLDNMKTEEDVTFTAEEIANKLKERISNVGRIVVYTEETDINELLGRPNQYISKATFEDKRVEQTNQYLDEDYFSEEEINEPQGGTIEVFKNEQDMKKRKDYLEAVTSSMSVFAEYSYGENIYLLRLDKSLTPTQAKEYEEIFCEIIK